MCRDPNCVHEGIHLQFAIPGYNFKVDEQMIELITYLRQKNLDTFASCQGDEKHATYVAFVPNTTKALKSFLKKVFPYQKNKDLEVQCYWQDLSNRFEYVLKLKSPSVIHEFLLALKTK